MPPPSLLLDDGPPLSLLYESGSSSSSSSSSPPPLRHRLRRTRSPSPTSRHLSHLITFVPSARPYSPSSREADIARLLDPAYASPAYHSPLAKSPRMALKEVYVDHHGDLHDPDFRDFPPSHIHSRQPRWERGFRDDDDGDDSDDEYQVDHHPRPSFDRQPRTPSSSIAYNPPPPLYYPSEEPSSHDPRFLAEDEVEEAERAPLKETPYHCSPRSRSKGQGEKQSPFATGGDRVIQADSEWTPTCTQNLRRHWQAITLSLRFSLFRTKRRLRRRLAG